MKFELSGSFDADWQGLSPDHRRLFRQAVEEINQAYAQRGSRPLPRWPAHLRIRRVQGRSGVWEMTWSFAGPDGRATFEFVTVDGEPRIRWRRIGSHAIFREP